MEKNNDKKYFYNRDLSWLDFNSRVLHEATKNRNPLFERAMFLAIASSNLDQFFMVRVPRLIETNELDKINKAVSSMIKIQYKQYRNLLLDLKQDTDIEIKSYEDLNKDETFLAEHYFKNNILPTITPVEIDNMHPVPHISSGTISLISILKNKNTKEEKFSLIQLRANQNRLIKLKNNKNLFILVEDLIKNNLKYLYKDFIIKETAIFRITRNEDLEILEHASDILDIPQEVEDELQKRKWGTPIRIEHSKNISAKIKTFIQGKIAPDTEDINEINGPIDLTFLWDIEKLNGYQKFKYPPLKDKYHKQLKGDVLLLHPFDSFKNITKLIQTSANDPDVISIKQTLYRVTHHDSEIINALIDAAKSDKEVVTLVELKARFDEAYNVHWAKELEKAGCQVIYGVKNLKVHAKCLLITKKENNKIKYYSQLGTGNYYPAAYTDFSLLTSKDKITSDVANLFSNLLGPQQNNNWKKLIVGPLFLKDKILELIEREIKNAKSNKKAEIIAKMNGLTDKKIIQKLYEASNSGVKINLIVRGACSLISGIKNLSENIKVYSIVGRFLEHNRVFYFLNNGNSECYLSSADWMTRNLEKRIEVLFPIEDNKNKEKIKHYLDNVLKDNVKRWIQLPNGNYKLVKRNKKEAKFNYQEYYFHKS
ncbi:polyphosphate kinase 1 [Cetobacterium sp. 2A]|uniref:polyphosphate kinase 1 n=1 Tax=Cetobacterium sp. 2A TaxID=2754723 RepID=UPI00163D0DB7|nr:polyphosphate kinase 1 [Cetobacterium sp. 2A]MBC2857201.1 polyphosphate kinase 1 [Cetobacterium sp. 2A]